MLLIWVRFLARSDIMTIFRRTPVGLIASGVSILGLFYFASAVTYAQPITNQRVMLINAQTGKCLTIAGGRSTDNNVTALQFNCDSDPSRTWRINGTGGVYQISNVQTGKCLTIAGGRSTDNNVTALQFNCDNDPSRTWRIRPAGQRID
jgi:cytolethal distending toxin subunit A